MIQSGDTVYVQANGATDYSWYPSSGVSNPVIANPFITPTITTLYCVTGKDSSNFCIDTACVYVEVKGTCFDIRTPNIFTPNADNVNDQWGIEFPCPQLVSDFSLSIYDRWGVKLFDTNKMNSRWDGYTPAGEQVSTGTYYYVAEFKISNKKQKVKGYFSLLR